MLAVLIFIIILSVLVMIHELGHFLMAKRAGIGVDEFGFGLPPRLWGKKVGETIYSINWLPFGGFVRLVGEDPTDKRRDEKNSFYHKTLFERTTVIVAGVFMNFALAVAIFYVVVFALGSKVSIPLYIDHKFSFVNETRQVLVSDVTTGSPADTAGIKMGESIVAVDGAEVGSVTDLQQIVRASADRDIKITLENPVDNKRREVVAKPTYSDQAQNVALGVNLGELAVLNYQTFPQKLFAGFIHSYNTVDYSIRVMADLIGFSVKTGDYRAVSEGVSGPVGIASIFQQAVALGPISVLQVAGLLSLNLAVLNILPFPALDGGRFFFIIVETVTRKRIHATFEKWAHTIGFVILIGLIILITYNDILKLINNQFNF